MKPVTCLLPLVAACSAGTADVKAPAQPSSSSGFAARLDGELAKRSGNLIYSPASIQAALAMAREGARGATADEMDRVLGASAGQDVRALLASIAPRPHRDGEPMPPELAIANRIFADQATPFEQAFLDTTRTAYGAPAERLDFRGDFNGARQHINAWVEDTTHERIKDLLGPGTLDKTTRMVLVNAIYLKAQWLTPFAEGATAPATFAVASGDTKQLPTMHATAPASWGEHAGARMLDLPYVGSPGTELEFAL